MFAMTMVRYTAITDVIKSERNRELAYAIILLISFRRMNKTPEVLWFFDVSCEVLYNELKNDTN